MADECWSELPQDILSLIIQELPTADRSRFRSVCLYWNSAPPAPPSLEIPWLVLPASTRDPKPQHLNFYSISDKKTYRFTGGHLTDIAANARAIISYSRDGWLMYTDKVCELQCVHLVTGDRIPVPSITCFPDIMGVYSDSEGQIAGYYMPHLVPCHRLYSYYKRGIIVFFDSPPNLSNSEFPSKKKKNLPTSDYNYKQPCSMLTVFAVCGDTSSTLVIAGRGEKSWVAIDAGYSLKYIDNLIMHNGSLFVSCNNGKHVVCIEFNNNQSIRSVGLVAALSPKINLLKSKKVEESTTYLVDIDGDLCLVWRGLYLQELEPKEDGAEEDDNTVMHITRSFVAYKFDEWKTTLSEMKSLEGNILFLGSNISMALPAHSFSQLDNDLIYFTDDLYVAAPRPWWDLGIFNLRDQSMHLYYDGLIPIDFPQPTWVTPFSLNAD